MSNQPKVKTKIGPALTWYELADIYQEETGLHPMFEGLDAAVRWARKQKDRFKITKDGKVHKVLKGEDNANSNQ